MRPTREMGARPIISSGLGGAIGPGTGDSDDPLDQYVLVTEGGRDAVFPHGDLGSTKDIDPTLGNVHSATLTADCTITLLLPDTTRLLAVTTLELYLTEDGTGGWEPTFEAQAGTLVWPDGSAPTHDTTPDTLTRYIFETLDDGATWYGLQVGSLSPLTVQDEGVSLATSAEVLNFVGAGVTASGTGATKTITIANSAPVDDDLVWMPLTTVDGGEPVLVWDGDDSLIPTLTPI